MLCMSNCTQELGVNVGLLQEQGLGASEGLAESDPFRVLHDSGRRSSPFIFFVSFVVDLQDSTATHQTRTPICTYSEASALCPYSAEYIAEPSLYNCPPYIYSSLQCQPHRFLFVSHLLQVLKVILQAIGGFFLPSGIYLIGHLLYKAPSSQLQEGLVYILALRYLQPIYQLYYIDVLESYSDVQQSQILSQQSFIQPQLLYLVFLDTRRQQFLAGSLMVQVFQTYNPGEKSLFQGCIEQGQLLRSQLIYFLLLLKQKRPTRRQERSHLQ